MASADGIEPQPVGALPRHLAALIQTNVNVQGLTVEAALTGRREAMHHAAMLDPHTAAELSLDEIASSSTRCSRRTAPGSRCRDRPRATRGSGSGSRRSAGRATSTSGTARTWRGSVGRGAAGATFEVLDAAYAGGVRYLDAARSYGRAEEFLGAWLDDAGPRTSSWARSGATSTPPTGRSTPTRPRSSTTTPTPSAASSRRRARSSATAWRSTRSTPPRLTAASRERRGAARAADLRATGVAIGVTASGPSQPETIDRAVELGCFDAVQATWNLHERAAGEALQRAHEAGMAVIVKEALANGRLGPRAHDAALAARRARWGRQPTQSRWPRCSRSRSPASCSAGPPRETRSRATSPPRSCGCRTRPRGAGALEEDSDEYWSTRSALPWN